MDFANRPLLTIFARNLELQAFRKGWTSQQLIKELDITQNAYNRIRQNRSRYLDPEILESAIELFDCTPNDLLLPQPDVVYGTSIRSSLR